MEGPERPIVVSVVPTYNEEKWIERCLSSLLAQTYPSDKHRIHVVDGGSTDSTLEIVRRLKDDSDGPQITIFDNPQRRVPHARNLSLANMQDDVELVFEVNAHGWVPEDHLGKRVSDMLEIEAELGIHIAGVGCRVMPSDDEDMGLFARWVESTLSCPLGSGGGQFARFTGRHQHKVPAFVIHRMEALQDAQGWDESLPTNQDSDLSMRLINRGWQLWRSDVSPFHMVKRRRPLEFVRMCRRYGFWRTKTLFRHGSRFNIREFLPLLGVILTLAMFFSGFQYWFAPLAAFGLAIVQVGFMEAIRSKDVSLIFGLPLLLPILHTMFTLGLFEGSIRRSLSIEDR